MYRKNSENLFQRYHGVLIATWIWKPNINLLLENVVLTRNVSSYIFLTRKINEAQKIYIQKTIDTKILSFNFDIFELLLYFLCICFLYVANHIRIYEIWGDIITKFEVFAYSFRYFKLNWARSLGIWAAPLESETFQIHHF